jgi:TonB family protein
MMRRTLSLAILPMILASFAGCAGPSKEHANIEQANVVTVPAQIIFDSCPKPVYPEAAQREKRQGTVTIAFHVDADNTVLDMKMKRSSGHADLDEAARIGLAKCKFRAATQNGSPVRDWAPIQYVWTL